MITYIPAALSHTDYIAEHIRELDREELRLTGASDPARAIRHAIALSDGLAVTALHGVTPVAVFGLAPNYLLGEGLPWMLGTDEIANHPRTLLRGARLMVSHWLKIVPLLMNEVWVGNTPAVAFLKHAGFTFAPPRENAYGAEMMLFYKRRS